MSTITIKQAQDFANDANINGVAAFLKQDNAKEFDRAIIDSIIESLMESCIKNIDGEMTRTTFLNIQRIANMSAY